MTKLAKWIKWLRPIILNKYLITLIGFLVFITFFEQHSLINRWVTYQKIKELEKEHSYYNDEIKKNKTEYERLKNDKKYIEKFAREHYNMKMDDEDIFIIK